MKKKDWYYIIGGVGVVAVGYYLYSMAKPKPTTGQKYLPEYGTGTENPLASNIYVKRVDLTQARNDEELIITAKYISVLKSTGQLSVKINDRNSATLDLTEVRSVASNIERLYLTNEAQSGCYVDLLISEGSIGIDYYPTIPVSNRQDVSIGYDVISASVTGTPVSYPFSFPQGISSTKSVDFLVTGDAVSVKIITPTYSNLEYFTLPANSFYSVPVTATSFSIKLATGSTTSTVEARGWY